MYQVTNNKDGNRTQNFTYDALNRIQTAYTNGPNWGEQYSIDTWGNMTGRNPVSGKSMYEPLNVGSATVQNRFPASSGFVYDADGNMTQNGGAHYTYDAEDRLMSAGGVNYTYDGDGQRVMKSSGTIYWGGGESGALAETDLSGNIQQEYIFFNGKRLARVDETNDTMHFYFADHLGSTSDVTDAVGNILEESDYYPYGGEIPIIAGDTNHYKFTGKERDSESGLDEFGARYYASSLGRFTIPDWAAKPTAVPYAHYGNPQSLNLYGYVQNNPTTFGDPDGHCCDEEVDYGAGVLRGIASSMSFGSFGAPKSTDSAASIAGQLTGTAMVGMVGEGEKDGGMGAVAVGLGAELPSGGTSTTVVVGGGLAIVAGSTMEAGAGANLARIVGAPLQAALPKPGTGPGSVSKDQRDPKRTWTKGERQQKLEQQNGQCANCGEPKTVDETNGHHVERHADGGKTDDANHAEVCEDCHKKLHGK